MRSARAARTAGSPAREARSPRSTVATLVGVFVLLLARDARTGGSLAGIGSGSTTALATAGFWLRVAAIVSAVDYLRGSLPFLLGAPPPAPQDRPPT